MLGKYIPDSIRENIPFSQPKEEPLNLDGVCNMLDSFISNVTNGRDENPTLQFIGRNKDFISGTLIGGTASDETSFFDYGDINDLLQPKIRAMLIFMKEYIIENPYCSKEDFLTATNKELKDRSFGKIFSKSLELRMALEIIVEDYIKYYSRAMNS